MRRPVRVVLPLIVPLTLGCGGDDLTLPGSGEPTTLSIVGGDGQSATVGAVLSQPLVVQLADARGQPVPGATVTFRFSDDPPDALVDPTTPATDSLGQASANVRLGSTPGSQPIDAQVAMRGQDLQVRFRLTALAKDPPSGGDPPVDGGSGGGGNGGGGSGGDGGGGGRAGGGGNGGGGNSGGDGGGHHHGGGPGKDHNGNGGDGGKGKGHGHD